jgi:hypothetical protein
VWCGAAAAAAAMEAAMIAKRIVLRRDKDVEK